MNKKKILKNQTEFEISNIKKKKETKKNKIEDEIIDEIDNEIENIKKRRGRPRKDEEEKINCLKEYKKKYYIENIKPFLPPSQRGRPKLIKTYEELKTDLINKRTLARALAQKKREQIKENKLNVF